MTSSDTPFVTVMMPVYREVQFIEKSLGCVLAQDYPADRMEVLIVDGVSDDGTRELVGEMAARDSRVRLLDNPRRNQADGLNVAIAEAAGEFLVRVDGHTEIPEHYISACVRVLKETGADNAGGMMRAVGHTPLTEAIALATNSPFATGGARFHYSAQAGDADTVYMGAFRRDVFERVGTFRAVFVPGEDYEMNARIRQAGRRVYYHPDIWSDYHVRRDYPALVKQYFRYGISKTRIMREHRGGVRLRHMVPPLAALALAIELGAVAAGWLPLWVVGAESGLYLAAIAGISITLCLRQRRLRRLALVAAALVTIHACWAAGFVYGLFSATGMRHG